MVITATTLPRAGLVPPPPEDDPTLPDQRFDPYAPENPERQAKAEAWLFLLDPLIRSRIYDSVYWKEHCFGLNESTLIDRVADHVRCVGGLYSASRVTPFLCLVQKLLQIAPSPAVVQLYIQHPGSKYVRALGAVGARLMLPAVDVYTLLEPLRTDCRKLRYRLASGQVRLLHVDELADMLLRDERVFGIALPRLTSRRLLEEAGTLDVYVSPLEESCEDEDVQMEPDVEHNDLADDESMQAPAEAIDAPRDEHAEHAEPDENDAGASRPYPGASPTSVARGHALLDNMPSAAHGGSDVPELPATSSARPSPPPPMVVDAATPARAATVPVTPADDQRPPSKKRKAGGQSGGRLGRLLKPAAAVSAETARPAADADAGPAPRADAEDSGGADGMSVEASNALRRKLGLPELR